jgi:hypothetical protein
MKVLRNQTNVSISSVSGKYGENDTSGNRSRKIFHKVDPEQEQHKNPPASQN